MKFKLPKHGDTRVVKRFTLFPIKIKGYMYWLQFIKIYQIYDVTKNKWVNESIFNN